MLETIEELIAEPGVRAALIVVGSILSAYVAEFIISRTLVVMAGKTKTDIDDKIVAALRRPIFLSVIFFGLSLATDELHVPRRWGRLVDGGLQTIAIGVWSMAALAIGAVLLHAVTARQRKNSIFQPRTRPVFDMVMKMAVIGVAIYFMFLAWDIDLTAWLASAGILGIAIGFAAKDTLANLFSGIFILADAPYKLGDFIVLDDNLRGRVTRIGIRSTRILTLDDVEITIPNALIGNSKIVNEAGGPSVRHRIAVPVSVAYGSDIDKVREVMLECGKGVDLIMDVPEPRVRFQEFGASGLEFALLVWVKAPKDREWVIDAVNTKLYKAFAVADIEIPYSKLDLYVKEMPRRAA